MAQRTDTYDVELWQLVPRQMTQEMYFVRELRIRHEDWTAILAAAPTPPASAQSVEPVGEALNFDNEHVKGMTGCLFAASEVPVGTKLYTAPPSAADVRDAALEEVAQEIERTRGRLLSADAIRALKSKKES